MENVRLSLDLSETKVDAPDAATREVVSTRSVTSC